MLPMNMVRQLGKMYWFIACNLFLGSYMWGCQQEGRKPEVRPQFQDFLAQANSIATSGRYEYGMAYLDSALQTLQPLSATEKIDRYQFHYIYYKEIKRDFEQANRYTDSVIILFDDEDFRRQHAYKYCLWMLNKGDVLINLDQFQEAFRYYYIGRSMIEREGDSCSRVDFSSRLAIVRYRQMNYRDAIRYFKQSFAEYQLCNEWREENYYEAVNEPQGVLNNIAWCHELLGESDSALIYYQKALDFLEAHAHRYPHHARDIKIAKAVVHGNLGGLYTKMGKLDSAGFFLQQSIATNSLPGYDHRDLQSAQIKLAELFIAQGRLDEAELQLLDVQAGLDSLPSLEYELRMLKAKWLCHDKMNNVQQAYASIQAYNQLKDATESLNQHILSTDFVKEFENIEQNLRLERLRFANRQNHIFLAIIGVALLLVSCVVYLVYRNWQSSKKNLVDLKEANDRIQEKNEKLQLALLALQDSQQDNTRILAMIAHDLRTPVANIKLGVDMLLSHHAANSVQRELLDVIGKSSGHLLEMVEELMHTYEKDTSLEKELIELETLMSDCVDLMQFKANEKQQTISIDTVPLVFCGSREKIWRIISNLIGNAIKFTPKSGHIHVSLERMGDEALIRVMDEGIGIPEEYSDKLFEMSHIYGRQGTSGEPSTGMGLAIVKQIVSSYQGKIYFDSYPNKGTTFYVHLPI